jgi:hypothetical protein
MIDDDEYTFIVTVFIICCDHELISQNSYHERMRERERESE